MMLQPPVKDEMEADREAIVDGSDLIISGNVTDVITDGTMVDKDEPVVVVEAVGNRVIVATKTLSLYNHVAVSSGSRSDIT